MPAKRCEPTQFPDDNEEPSTSSGCRGRKRKAKKAFQDDDDQEDLMPATRRKPTQFPDDSEEPSTSSGRRGRKRKAKKAFQDDDDQEDLMPATRRKPTQFPDESEEPSTSSGGRGRKRKMEEAFKDDEDQEDLMPATQHKPTQFPDESEEPSTSSGRRGRKRKVEEAFQDDENQEDLMLPPQFPDERDEPSPSSVEEASQVDEDQEDLMPAASSEPSQFPDEIEEPGTSSGSREGNAEQHFLDDDDDDPYFCRRDTGPGSPLDKYELGRKLGKGIYGTVYVATRKSDGKKVALKFVYMPNCYINRKPGRVFYPTSEARIMLELKKPSLCPHIIELYDFFEVEEYDVLVMEYMQPSMTLTAFFRRNNGPLTESVARHLILQILIALEHCLEHGIDHRAIYEENILVNPKTLQVKLIGFGCSDYIRGHLKPHAGFDQIYCKCMWHSRLVEVGGLRNVHVALQETVECVARLLARMVNGYWPLRSMVEYPRFHPSVSKECRDLLKMCFGFNVDDGPTLEDIIDHKWFSKKIDT
nr:aurora kinase A-like isoform X6 [Danio rerio]|eukprot:XP_021332282.1 aurora kinase A-like isoform X6 [Danio rerio]